MEQAKQKRGKKTMWILLIVAMILLVQTIFIGYRFSWGPFKGLGERRMAKLPGNDPVYGMDSLEPIADSPLQGQNVLFLGSSVTYGAASLQEGIPEYFGKRLACNVTKEAVSGTTLTDNGQSSYVQRLLNRVDPDKPFALLVCQLSTNDATKQLPLGEIATGTGLSDFDTATVTGAMEYIIAYAEKTWHCPVVFYTNARYDSESYASMVARLKQLQEKWNIGVLDLWSDEIFNTISETDRALYMNDSIHPTKAGYRQWWCPELERQLLAYLAQQEALK